MAISINTGPRRTWNGVPSDSNTSPAMNDFLNWLMTSVTDLQGSITPAVAPQVTTVSYPGSVLIAWNEQPSISSYAIYEMDTKASPPGLPLIIVPANMAAQSGSYLRQGLFDTTTRYYSVMAISQWTRSPLSQPVPGTALSTAAALTAVSASPVNSNGVGGGVGGGGGLFSRGQL
jgi:hypothetical protein